MTDSVFESLFNPRSVAVIGASNTFGKWGFNIFNRVLASADGRKVYPVNAEASEVVGIKAYNRVTAVPGPVDLAVVTVPPQHVLEALRDCVEKGVKVAEIITAGFGEAGDDGIELERRAVAIAREGGIRLVGPNSMGHLSAHADFYTTPWITGVPKGGVGLISQSGNFGINIIRRGVEMGIGFSKFVSSGNEADLTFEDYLEYLAGDPDTTVIAAYVEGLRQGRRFLKVARETTKRKPVVILKAGRTGAGARAAHSHTAALAGEDRIYDAAFKQTGVIRVNAVDEILDTAGALARQPLPRGRRVGILTGGGGPGVIATDACARAGLEIADLTAPTIAKLDKILPPRWPRGNPVDMVGETNLTYPCLLTLIEDENVDAVFSLAVGFADAIRTIIMDYVKADLHGDVSEFIKAEEKREIAALTKVIERMDALGKPVFLFPPSGIEEFATMKHLRENGILTYASIERGARVLAHLADYAEYLGDSDAP
ncbi:MAG: acetyl-CoA synthetase [Chloroflexi bacterium]|nr:acetyl-CoA synthetase [Chloroflexota bacterium]